MLFAGSHTLEPGIDLTSRIPALPYAPRKRDGTPGGGTPVETLDVGHPGHTFDSERDLEGDSEQNCGRPGLENERRQPLKPGQNRDRRIEKRPVPEIVMGVRHDRRPRRLRHGKNPDQPAAFLELPVKPSGVTSVAPLSTITS